jgi:hypothetical protein
MPLRTTAEELSLVRLILNVFESDVPKLPAEIGQTGTVSVLVKVLVGVKVIVGECVGDGVNVIEAVFVLVGDKVGVKV